MTKPLIALVLMAIGHCGYAAPHIAILDFELNDITSLPNTPEELARTASIRPLLEQAIRQAGNYQIVPIQAAAQTAANAGFGYLFRFHDQAAKLGQQAGADWVIVSQHSKPSFLYSYLIAHLVNVKTRSLSARFDIELKGNHPKVTEHAVDALAKKIKSFIGEP